MHSFIHPSRISSTNLKAIQTGFANLFNARRREEVNGYHMIAVIIPNKINIATQDGPAGSVISYRWPLVNGGFVTPKAAIELNAWLNSEAGVAVGAGCRLIDS
ncbi:hypothetical protein, partial [Spirosoma spitsbergense]|uniref:hypothetical protein n=1 Tax=Spirosoma spitsbergense TaxID=431554 RepID=UPI0005A7F78C